MRPPSAAAFMGNYGMDNATINVGMALYGGDLIDNDELPREVREQTEYEIDQAEWFLMVCLMCLGKRASFCMVLDWKRLLPFSSWALYLLILEFLLGVLFILH